MKFDGKAGIMVGRERNRGTAQAEEPPTAGTKTLPAKTILRWDGEKIMDDSFITFTIGKRKTIALIAHDGKKRELIEWCAENQEILKKHTLCGTGTTAMLVAEKTGLPVKGYNSGPLGGDQQIGAKIVEGVVDFVVFFSDPLEAQPHDPDVKALLRIAQVYDIPIANNRATADFMIRSPLMDQEYEHKVINFKRNVAERVQEKSRLI